MYKEGGRGGAASKFVAYYNKRISYTDITQERKVASGTVSAGDQQLDGPKV